MAGLRQTMADHETTMTGLSTTERQFLHLLRCGVQRIAPDAALFPAAETDWQRLMSLSEDQAVTGVVFWAVRQLPKEQQPPRREVFLPWLSLVEDICQRNEKLNVTCGKVVRRFAKAGFRACVLKGQGAARLYPDPLLRIPGDIDVWLWPEKIPLGQEKSLSERRRAAVAYVRHYNPEVEVVYHHVDFNVLKSALMEVHFTPSWMHSPCRNAWLQRWFERQAGRVFAGCASEKGLSEIDKHVPHDFTTPDAAFNLVYMLIHVFRHLFTEGIGFRQIVDYYYLLTSCNLAKERASAVETLRHLGLDHFAGALMYVLHEVMGLSDEQMLVPARSREGQQLLQEILFAGNFGHADTRFQHYADGTLGAFWTRSCRNFNFIREYPSEVLWTPVWKIGQYVWRRHCGFL